MASDIPRWCDVSDKHKRAPIGAQGKPLLRFLRIRGVQRPAPLGRKKGDGIAAAALL
jgi:hypothetical protein